MAWPSEAGAIAGIIGRAATPRRRTALPSGVITPPILAVVGYSSQSSGKLLRVTVLTELVGRVFYHWYTDGIYAGVTAQAWKTFWLESGEQTRVECWPTNDPLFDYQANAPAGWPARRRIWWVRSLDANVARYRVEQQIGAGAWTQIAMIPARAGTWSYEIITPRLTDLTTYSWRVTPLDGNDLAGTAITIGPELVVRQPDAPWVTVTVDGEDDEVVIDD